MFPEKDKFALCEYVFACLRNFWESTAHIIKSPDCVASEFLLHDYTIFYAYFAKGLDRTIVVIDNCLQH